MLTGRGVAVEEPAVWSQRRLCAGHSSHKAARPSILTGSRRNGGARRRGRLGGRERGTEGGCRERGRERGRGSLNRGGGRPIFWVSRRGGFLLAWRVDGVLAPERQTNGRCTNDSSSCTKLRHDDASVTALGGTWTSGISSRDGRAAGGLGLASGGGVQACQNNARRGVLLFVVDDAQSRGRARRVRGRERKNRK